MAGQDGSTPVVFGLWETAFSPAQENLAFDLGGAVPAQQEYSIWRADLPADSVEAERVLAQRDAQIQQISERLDNLPGTIQAVAKQAANPSFDLASNSVGPEELRLLGMVSDINQAGTGGLSFGLAEAFGIDWAKAYQEFRVSFERVQQLITQMAWVETNSGGQLIGWTVVGWSGDLNTTWGTAVSPEQREQHKHSLRQALATRIALIRILATTLQGAGMLGVLITNPGGIIFSLPAVWKYINQVMDQVKQYQQVSQP